MADKFALFVRDGEECKKATTRARLALYALAARADKNGYCWPSVEQIMEDTGMSRASVFRALMEVREILTVDAPGYKKSNSYIFPFQEKAETAIEKSRARNNRARAVAQGGMADGTAGGMADGTAIDKTLMGKGGKLSTKGGKVINKSLKLGRGQSQIEIDSLKLRPQGSQIETGGGLKLRPEEERGRIQEVSLSLDLPQTRSTGGANVDNLPQGGAQGGTKAAQGAGQGADAGQGAEAHAYDGTTRPKTRADVERIRFWCKAAGLDEAHTTDFLRINRLAHWRQIDATTTVCDLIADFAFKWKKDDPEGYFYFNDKRKGIRRG
jgi:hypothetical protein